MIKVFWAILALVLFLSGCQLPAGSSQGTGIGSLAPDFQLESLDGQGVTLSELRGRPVMLNFWATWCPPCRAEMPWLEQIYEEWTGKPPSVVMLTVNNGESPSRVRGFMETYNLSLPVLLDTDERVAGRYGIRYIPTTFFIDEDGIIQQKVVGAFTGKDAIEEGLRRIVP